MPSQIGSTPTDTEEATDATAADVDIAEEDIEPLADETAHQAQRVVAAYATDADECRMLLSMLGIGPTTKSD